MMGLRKFVFFAVISMFLFVPVLSQNQRTDGYKGLWTSVPFLRGNGIRYSGGMATYSAQHNPTAIFSPHAGKTFFVYGGTSDKTKSNLQIMVSYFDHKTLTVPRPVMVYDKEGVSDPQDNASISLDDSGFVYVFISGIGRTRPGFIFKSSQPYNIEKFNLVYRGELVFPQPWWMESNKFVMLHSMVRKGRELFCSVSEDGSNWKVQNKIAALGGSNQVTESNGRTIFTAFNYFPGGSPDRLTNLYFLYSNDLGETWMNADGKNIDLPVTQVINDCIVRNYEEEKKLVYIKDMTFDEEGNPAILILTSNDFRPGPGSDPREWVLVHRKNNKWEFTKLFKTLHNSDMGSIFIDKEGWRVIAPSEPGHVKYSMGGEIAVWTSTDRGYTWTKSNVLTNGGNKNSNFVRRPVNTNKSFYCFWTDGDPEKISECRLYFTDSKAKSVWELPYEMKRDTEKPRKTVIRQSKVK